MRRLRPSGAIAWSWPAAVRGLIYAAPAGVVALVDVRAGSGLAVGLIPAAILPLPPRRRVRYRIAVISAVAGASMAAGSILAAHTLLAVAGLFLLCLGAALLAATRQVGMLVLTLCVPIIAVGFSYPGIENADKGLTLVLGGTYAWLVSLAWPQRHTAPRPAMSLPSRAAMIDYGIRLGLAGAICAGIGFTFGFDHAGWAAACALLVMRPEADAQRLRTTGRIGSVLIGALVAVALIDWGAPDILIAVTVTVAVVVATATARSRWYLTPAFTTYLVFLLLALGDSGAAEDRFWERFGETLLGAGVAYMLGVTVPALRSRRRANGSSGGVARS